MKNFFDPIKPEQENTFVYATPMYLELQKHSFDLAGISYTYILRWSDSAFFIAACWGHQFDPILPLLQDRKMGRVWFDVFNDTWPTVGRLLDNGINARYSDGALLIIEDPDDGEKKWVVGTVVGNLSLNSPEELEQVLFSDRMMHAYELVLLSSFIIGEEMSTRPFSIKWKLKTLAYQMFHAQVEAIELASIWVPKITNLFGK